MIRPNSTFASLGVSNQAPQINTSLDQALEVSPKRAKSAPSHSNVMKHYSTQIKVFGVYLLMAVVACLFYILGLFQINVFYDNYLTTLPVYQCLESRASSLSYTFSFKVQSLRSSQPSTQSLQSFYANQTTQIQ